YQKYIHHFLNPSLSSEIDESLNFSKQSNKFYTLLISTKDENNYGDDFLLAAQKFINDSDNWQSLTSSSARARQPSKLTLESNQTNSMLKDKSKSPNQQKSEHPHVAGPILDQQQAVNIFCNYRENYDTVWEIIGLANNVLFGSPQEQNYILISQNEELRVKNKKVEERNYALETENSNLKVKNKEIEERSHALESQNIILKTENAELKLKDDNQAKLKTQYVVLQSEHVNLISLFKELEVKNTQSENKFKDINKRYGKLLTEYSNLEAIYAILENIEKDLLKII
ncbi:4686_t:CDS:2, partial [Gigaspora margarita]